MGDVGGFWDESVKSVNAMIDDLVHPTSETARVIGAVAQGDLSQTMALEVDGVPLKGEFLQDGPHHQQDGRSARFLCVAKSPASPAKWEPKESSAARPACKGVAGTWKDLTESVNSMAEQPDQLRCVISPK